MHQCPVLRLTPHSLHHLANALRMRLDPPPHHLSKHTTRMPALPPPPLHMPSLPPPTFNMPALPLHPSQALGLYPRSLRLLQLLTALEARAHAHARLQQFMRAGASTHPSAILLALLLAGEAQRQQVRVCVCAYVHARVSTRAWACFRGGALPSERNCFLRPGPSVNCTPLSFERPTAAVILERPTAAVILPCKLLADATSLTRLPIPHAHAPACPPLPTPLQVGSAKGARLRPLLERAAATPQLATSPQLWLMYLRWCGVGWGGVGWGWDGQWWRTCPICWPC